LNAYERKGSRTKGVRVLAITSSLGTCTKGVRVARWEHVQKVHVWLIGNALETRTRGVRVGRQLARWDSGTHSHAELNTWILC